MEGATVTPEEIVGVCARLPERQREALALHGAERLSYEEIAERMDTSPGSVAQLISRARINLYDELRGTALASVAPPSPECEQALPLIAAREDGQLKAVSGDPAWLDAHLASCERCRLGMEQMHEAEDAYRAGAPIEPLGESPANALPAPRSPSAAPLPGSSRTGLPRSRALLVGALAALLLLGGLAAAFVRDAGAPAPGSSAADAALAQGNRKSDSGAKAARAGAEKGGAAKGKAKTSSTAGERSGSGNSPTAATPTPLAVPVQATSGGGARSEPVSGSTGSSGKTAVKPKQQTSASKPTPKPKPAPTATPTSQPSSGTTAPATEAQPPAEEPSDAPGRSGEAPGKPAGHPSH